VAQDRGSGSGNVAHPPMPARIGRRRLPRFLETETRPSGIATQGMGRPVTYGDLLRGGRSQARPHGGARASGGAGRISPAPGMQADQTDFWGAARPRRPDRHGATTRTKAIARIAGPAFCDLFRRKTNPQTANAQHATYSHFPDWYIQNRMGFFEPQEPPRLSGPFGASRRILIEVP